MQNALLTKFIQEEQEDRASPSSVPATPSRFTSRSRKATKNASRPSEGTVIARNNTGMGESITVRKVSFGQGVERIFPVNANVIDHIDVVRTGRVRRAKLYYLRGLKGKAARLRERDLSRSRTALASMRAESAGGKIRCEATLERELRARGFTPWPVSTRWAAAACSVRWWRRAVILSADRPVRGLNDSKLLEPERREVLAERIRERAVAWAVAAVDAATIDHINIYQASRLAMRLAVERLSSGARFSADRCRAARFPAAAARAHQGRHALPRHRRRLHRRQGAARRLHARVGRGLPRVRPGLAQRLRHSRTLSRAAAARTHSAAPAELRTGARTLPFPSTTLRRWICSTAAGAA